MQLQGTKMGVAHNTKMTPSQQTKSHSHCHSDDFGDDFGASSFVCFVLFCTLWNCVKPPGGGGLW